MTARDSTLARPCLLTDASFLMVARGESLSADLTQPLDLPPLAHAGAVALDRAARNAAAAAPGGIVAGLVPFDPTQPPALAVLVDPVRRPHPVAHGPVRSRSRSEIPHDPAYERAVADALRLLDHGVLDKVVLARHVHVDATHIDVESVLTTLTALNPAGWTYAVRTGSATVVGASPELVASVHGGWLRSHPLAGSAPRTGDAAADDARAAALLTSAKNAHEHRIVVEQLAERLGPLTTQLDVPAAPQVMRTDTMLHLGTSLTGRALPDVGSLEAALTVHPTPAVCGTPTERALDVIRELEPHPRGFYAGLVGWTDADGNGEWALALRCALVDDHGAVLSAGAGIVRGSDPHDEHAETTAKLGTVLHAIDPHATLPLGLLPNDAQDIA